MYNADGEHVNSAFTTLVFVDAKTGRPIKAPANFISKLKEAMG